ncbi:hypothetical protein B0H15DRAFT_949425 [Mycena belliarum]|uniref:Uncharacterized protein n=1 Tax=Mycena belliarum TaxID=1033014 RepID=A0AAD6U5S3_9AGAR|nr:hypothetical protein B0H15DRAFT_949425 [Mycena belliae]
MVSHLSYLSFSALQPPPPPSLATPQTRPPTHTTVCSVARSPRSQRFKRVPKHTTSAAPPPSANTRGVCSAAAALVRDGASPEMRIDRRRRLRSQHRPHPRAHTTSAPLPSLATPQTPHTTSATPPLPSLATLSPSATTHDAAALPRRISAPREYLLYMHATRPSCAPPAPPKTHGAARSSPFGADRVSRRRPRDPPSERASSPPRPCQPAPLESRLGTFAAAALHNVASTGACPMPAGRLGSNLPRDLRADMRRRLFRHGPASGIRPPGTSGPCKPPARGSSSAGAMPPTTTSPCKSREDQRAGAACSPRRRADAPRLFMHASTSAPRAERLARLERSAQVPTSPNPSALLPRLAPSPVGIAFDAARPLARSREDQRADSPDARRAVGAHCAATPRRIPPARRRPRAPTRKRPYLSKTPGSFPEAPSVPKAPVLKRHFRAEFRPRVPLPASPPPALRLAHPPSASATRQSARCAAFPVPRTQRRPRIRGPVCARGSGSPAALAGIATAAQPESARKLRTARRTRSRRRSRKLARAFVRKRASQMCRAGPVAGSADAFGSRSRVPRSGGGPLSQAVNTARARGRPRPALNARTQRNAGGVQSASKH